MSVRLYSSLPLGAKPLEAKGEAASIYIYIVSAVSLCLSMFLFPSDFLSFAFINVDILVLRKFLRPLNI